MLGVSGVISQGNDIETAHIIAFRSWKFNSAQRNYPILLKKDPFVANRCVRLLICWNVEIQPLRFRFLNFETTQGGYFEILKSHKGNRYLQWMGKFLAE